ncbi:pH-response regulator protein palC [Kwoniella shandongensis]|uniref:pH-response regulator protein palC n=1 Tax=Kwoniella shandongensis TaxID=1734106 RepID=A0A5M6BVY5_9TREE|nr:pH-response regulator protein palC [Kwoniella shandongensis]KAA5527026.1 pH-response regulator protein palC [Kwoniella shandongensis]
MPPYLFPLPTTSLITFSSILHDPSSSYTSVLSEATAARTRLHLALKGVAENEPSSSALAVLDAVQVYLPYLRGIVACLDADELLFKGEPTFPWRAPLTHYTMTSPLLPLISIHGEHLFVILTYTLALSNYAHSILASLPVFELQAGASKSAGAAPHMSTEDEKRTAAGLTRAVDLLCQASGVAEWAAENVCLTVEPIKSASGGRLGKHRWPAESSRETFMGLSTMFLADAHLTAIRKLLLPVLPHTLFAPPGPPLPSNHPSASLLGKLYLHVTKMYISSRALLKVHQTSPSFSGEGSHRKLFGMLDKDKELPEADSVEGEIIPPLKRYLRKESLLALALSHKWMGVDAGENGKGAKVGEAIAWCKDAQEKLEKLEDSKMREKMKGLGLGRGNERKKEERKARKGRVEREVEDVKAWIKTYTKMNDTVAFQPIPPMSSLMTSSGRSIFASKPFTPPPSKFEPNRRARLDNADGEDEGEDAERDEVVEANYAGKGNYY